MYFRLSHLAFVPMMVMCVDTLFAKPLTLSHLGLLFYNSGIAKRVTAHTFRHTFATQLLLHGADISRVQD
ncbi:tyrosine-type recombinase/integrase [Saliniradius amylolyticus]|uniref:tyrosine-type recombinase/integrase n=1 Tax=Saliniradius amylolyticus TaxID=2183582 RepID=UPI0030B81EE5